MAQSSISEFFTSRKRPATDDLQLKSRKVFVFDKSGKIKTPVKQTNALTAEICREENLVQFWKKGFLSPKKLREARPEVPAKDSPCKDAVEHEKKIPDKPEASTSKAAVSKKLFTKDADLDAIKAKITTHPKAKDFAKRVQTLRQNINEFKKAKILEQSPVKRADIHASPKLKKFDTVEIEVMR